MRRLRLKVCGMRDAANIADVGAINPDYIGFIFVPSSPRYIGTTLQPNEIILPPSVHRIGVFRDLPVEHVIEISQAFALDGIQLHGNEGLAYMQELRRMLPSVSICKAVSVQSADDVARLSVRGGLPDMFLLDGKSPGSGQAFDWELLSHYQAPVGFLLAGGIGVSDIPHIKVLAERFPLLLGIDINSQVEISPGIKNVHDIKEIVSRLLV